MTARKVTERQARKVLEAVRDQFAPWLVDTDDGPELRMEFDWLGYGAHPAIVWEGGPYEWALVVPYGCPARSDSEMGEIGNVAHRIPKGVYVEPDTTWALGIYPD